MVGHRGSGMNMDLRMKAIKENSILSFNEAGKSGVDFVEFDVQVCDGVTFSVNFFFSPVIQAVEVV